MTAAHCLLGDHHVSLLPSGGAFLPALRALIVADVHLGQDHFFRSRGISLPQGSAAADLARLDADCRHTGACELVIAGDWIHRPSAINEGLRAAIQHWRHGLRVETVTLVTGNHDRGWQPATADRMAQVPSWHCGDLRVVHEPPASCQGPTICGHIHPVVRVGGPADSATFPAFWRHGDCLHLPAYGSTTGGGRIAPEAEDDCWVIADNAVHALML